MRRPMPRRWSTIRLHKTSTIAQHSKSQNGSSRFIWNPMKTNQICNPITYIDAPYSMELLEFDFELSLTRNPIKFINTNKKTQIPKMTLKVLNFLMKLFVALVSLSKTTRTVGILIRAFEFRMLTKVKLWIQFCNLRSKIENVTLGPKSSF